MRRLRFRSIRSRIALVILACTALSLGVAFATVIVSDVRQFRGDMVENTLLVARVVGDYSVSDLAFGDRTESARTLSTLGSIPSVLSARLYDTSGHLFSSWARPGAGEPRAETPSGTFEKGVLHVEQPIVYNGESYGSIALEASTADLDRKVRRYLALMLSLMLGLIVLAGAAAVKLQALISEPILALAATARQVSEEHDYSVRMARTGDDEIGTLCDGFNDMLAQIERRQHERDLADQRTREKSQFLANMSHELRTPLNSILGFSEILLERLPDRVSAREMKFLQNINNSGQHLLGIINDILDLSKVEAGRMEVHPERVSLTNVVDSVVNVMKGVSAKRRVGFDIDIAEDVPFIEADAVKMKQVLYNLASNAVKFSPEGGTVAIRVGCLAAEASPLGKASVQMAVTDQGPGIDAIDQDLVFQEFRQAKDGARQVEGTGLGLALVKRFVELHDGLVRLTSSPGVGSTFTVVLPVFFRGADQPVASPSSPGESSGPAVRVLVVEDDAGAYKRLAQDLAAARYVPIWARTAEEAVGLARGLRPQAIVLDVLLRGVDGFDVLRQLKTDPGTRQVPLILVSVLENQELGMVLGAADCFVKPLDQESVVRRLRSLVPPGEDDNRLLLIDDDPSVHESLDSWLGAVGYTVDHALTGEQGLARAAECPPALVLLDLAMEPMDGFEAALRLKDDPRTRHAPIVMLSSRDVDGDERLRLRGRLASRLHGSPGALTSVLQAMLARSQ